MVVVFQAEKSIVLQMIINEKSNFYMFCVLSRSINRSLG